MHGSLRALAAGATVLACLANVAPAVAQDEEPPNSLLLIAKPGLGDANFRRTVVLVTQAPDASTVGVILNRPTALELSGFFGPSVPIQNYRDSIYFGGPVMPQVIVALFRAETPPSAPAFHVLKGLYLTMRPGNVESLLATAGARYRLYAGFSGWLPTQLESELARDDWYVLPADDEIVFRRDTGNMWEELLARAAGMHAGAGTPSRPPQRTVQIESPAEAGLDSRITRAVP
jgi:putative transcriptional regulator